MSIKVECTTCHKEFQTDATTVKTQNIGGGVEVVYFECPLCETQYPVMKTNQEIRAKQKQLGDYIDKLKVKDGGADFNDAAKLAILQRELKALIDEFNYKE